VAATHLEVMCQMVVGAAVPIKGVAEKDSLVLHCFLTWFDLVGAGHIIFATTNQSIMFLVAFIIYSTVEICFALEFCYGVYNQYDSFIYWLKT
jgi:hypothetical protein